MDKFADLMTALGQNEIKVRVDYGTGGRQTIIDGDECARVTSTWLRCLSLGFEWAVRLFLALFLAIAVTTWTDLFFAPVISEHLIGSEHACTIHYANCSWRNYILLELLPSSLLAAGAIVALACAGCVIGKRS